MSGHITERFDHDGMFRHHHAAYTGDGYEEGEPIWWGNADRFGGLKRDHRHSPSLAARAAAPPVGPTVSERYQPGMTWDDKRGGFVEIVPPSPEPDAWTDADDDAVLAATAEACRDAVTDSTQRLVVAFRRFVLERFGTAMTEDDFRSILRDAARLANRDSDAAGTTSMATDREAGA